MIERFGIEAGSWTGMAWQVAWQSTAVLSIGLLAARLIPMRPARAHRILLASLCACLFVPPAHLIARRLDLGLLEPRIAATTPPTIPQTPPSTRPAADASELVAEPPTPLITPSTSLVVRPSPTPSIVPTRRSFAIAIPVLWASLTAFGLVRLAVGFASGLNLLRRSRPVGDPALLDAAVMAARSLDLGNPPAVRISPIVRCPVVWCWSKRPTLVLPVDAGSQADWSAVLCHELAHWKRGDHLSALLAELLTCLLPWQPLSWVIRNRMADLSELACDDWALAHAAGVSRSDYAEALLALVADPRRPLVPAAVSRRSGLVARIGHILEETMPKPLAGRTWSTLLVGLSLALVALLALAQTRTARAIAGLPPIADDAQQEPGDPTTVMGVVRDSEGRPVAGAEVRWIAAVAPPVSHVAMPRDHPDYGKRWIKTLGQGTTDAEGRFSLTARVVKPSTNGPWPMLLAHRDGYAPVGASLALDDKPVEVVLQPPVPIVGHLLTPGGEPAVGVEIRITGYSNGNWRDARAMRGVQFEADAIWDEYPPFFPGAVTSDEAGRFTLEGVVPVGSFATLTLAHPDFAKDEVTVSTGASAEPTAELAAFSIKPVAREFTHTLGPARPVVGRVTDAATGQPLADVTLTVMPMRRHGGMPIRTTTDDDGRYRVSDREGESYWVSVYPAAGSGYLPVQRGGLTWPAGSEELVVDIPLRSGRVVTGRVVDADTGEPVAGAGVIFTPTRANKNVHDDDDFRSPTLTDADGRFRLNGIAGPGVVAVEGPTDAYIRQAVAPVDFTYQSSVFPHGLARIEVPDEGDIPEVTVPIRQGFTLQARAVRPDGQPLPYVQAWCPELSARLLDNWVAPNDFNDGLFSLPGAEPGRTYRVFFLQLDEHLGALAEIVADPSRPGPIEVKLQPTASLTGRVVDNDGNPIEGAQVLPNIQLIDKGPKLSERDRFDSFVTQVYTQFTNEPLKQVYPAEFRYDRLIPGVRYFVTWYIPGSGAHLWKAIEPLAPGEVRALGDITPDPKEGGDDE